MTVAMDRVETVPLLAKGKFLSTPSETLPGTNCPVYAGLSIAPFTSFRVGGPAEWLVSPRHWEELQIAFDWAQKKGLPVTLLGAGSNLLVSDRGIPGLVISTRYLRHSHFDSDNGRITAGAGDQLAKLAWQAAKRGWQGFEWAVGIPGSVGGSVVMNAGAHKACIADRLISALVLNPNGAIEEIKPESMGYKYRTSNLQGDQRLVLQATFQLSPGYSKTEIMAQSSHNLQHRKSTQPYHLPSCGSVFRNPEPHAAGWLIEQLGLKGYQIGGAQIAHRHANFILNCGNATARDIFQIIRHVQEQVEHHWSLTLEPEVRLLGEF